MFIHGLGVSQRSPTGQLVRRRIASHEEDAKLVIPVQ